MKTHIMLLLGLLASLQTCLAQPTSLSGNISSNDTFQVILKLYPHGYFRQIPDELVVERKADVVTGMFNFALPELTRTTYFSLTVQQAGKIRYRLDRRLLSPGDSLVLTFRVDEDGFMPNFSGRGCERIGLEQQLTEIKTCLASSNPKELAERQIPRDPFNTRFMEWGIMKRQRLIAKQIKNVNDNASLLSEEERQILVNDIHLGPFLQWADNMLFLLKSKDDSKHAEVAQFLAKLNRSEVIAQVSEAYKTRSKYYVDLAYRMMQIDYMLNYHTNIPFDTLCANIDHTEVGVVHDAMFVSIFTRLYQASSTQKLQLNRAIKRIKHPDFSAALHAIKAKWNVKAYPFVLESINGELVRMRDFTGKTVVLDFWFTGCASCAAIERIMKPIRTSMENNPNVVFISICVDEDRDRWKSSVSSGVYTDERAINLFTNGEGMGHDLIKFYRFTGFPQMLVIDPNQLIIAVNPLSSSNSSKRLFQSLNEGHAEEY